MGVHVVARVGDIPDGGRLIVNLEGRSIGVFHVNGSYFALRNSCPHQSGPACEGAIFPAIRARVLENGRVKEYHDYDQLVIACPWHGWEFDMKSGVCLADSDRRVRVYEARVEGDDVLVVL